MFKNFRQTQSFAHFSVRFCFSLGKEFVQNFISSRDGPEKVQKTRCEMKECKKTTLHQQKYTADVG